MAIIKIIKTTIIEEELAEFNSETNINFIMGRLNKFKEENETKTTRVNLTLVEGFVSKK